MPNVGLVPHINQQHLGLLFLLSIQRICVTVQRNVRFIKSISILPERDEIKKTG
jgi:hypothetical protein